MDEQKIIEAFHLMWDHFPEPVLLIKKNRQIYAANRKAVSFGMDKQVRCSDRGNPEQHKGCLYGYWMPVTGAEDYIIHFSVGAFTVPES